jgi:CheY-like chemotaxis protein
MAPEQTGRVEADLRRCLAEWESLGRIDPFTLGMRDTSDRLAVPERVYVESAPERFDAVITDEVMPGITGTALAARLASTPGRLADRARERLHRSDAGRAGARRRRDGDPQETGAVAGIRAALLTSKKTQSLRPLCPLVMRVRLPACLKSNQPKLARADGTFRQRSDRSRTERTPQ